MANILIVYTTSWGSTKLMAESVADGARSVEGASVSLKEAGQATKEDVLQCDALIVGSPVRHRSMDARIKDFIERTLEVLWLTDETVGKVGGVFTVGGGYGNAGAGCEMAQLGIHNAFVASGMIPVPLPKTTPGFAVAGMHWGANGRSGGLDMTPQKLTDEMLECGFHHGANIARIADALRGKELFARGNVAPTPELIALFGGAAGGEGAPPPEDS